MRDFALAISALLAFLLPIGFYCLILGSINRRGKPLMVSGVWDAVGLLFAVSGFFLATMPMLIAEFYQRTFTFDADEHFFNLWMQHWILWIVYFLFLLSGGALMILWRTPKTMIYNVDPELFPKALERTLAHLAMSMTMKDGRIMLRPQIPSENQESTAFTEVAPKAVAPLDNSRLTELEIETFPAMCHVTLHWDNDAPAIRRQIEIELNKSLESAAPLDNPAAGWFLNISGLIIGSLLMVVLAFVILLIMSRR